MHKAAIEGRAQKVEKALQEQAAAVNKQISGESQRVEVARDDRSGRFVMRVVDSDSGQLLRQFPPESVLKVNERLDELSGMLLAVEA
jgi:flagellar protein FlaG